MLRVSVCGGQPYLNPVIRNGRVRDKWADYKGTPTHFQKGTYALRYKQGTRLVFTTVGKALDAALMAQRRKEVEFQAASTGLLIQHTRQTAPADPKKPKTEIKEAIKKFLDDVAMRDRPATEQGYRFTLELFMAANPGLKTLEEIEREHCVGFVHYLRDKRKVVNRTISNHLTTVGTLLRFFKREMPLDGRDWPRYTQKSIIVYTEDRLGTLLDAATPEERLLLMFFLGSGGREREVEFTCWTDLNFETKMVTFTAKPDLKFSLKDYEERSVPLPDDLLEELKLHRAANPKSRLVFPTKKGKPNSHFLRIIKDVALRAGLNCGHCINKVGESCLQNPVCALWQLHHLRRTFASRHYASGVEPMALKELMGHSDLETTERYLAEFRKSSEATRTMVNRAFGDLFKSTPRLVA
jgi:integrase/recombinase XerD